MATITVKKKKPMPLRGGGDVASGEGTEESSNTPAVVDAVPAPAAAAPAPMAPIVAQGPSYTLHGVLAIVATVLFLAVILLQWLELSHYKAPPAVFPAPPAAASAS